MAISIRRILFPNDFSEPARQALHYAMALADRFGAELHLLHVVPEIAMSLPDSSTFWTLPEPDLQLQVEEATRQLRADLGEEWAQQHQTFQTAVRGLVLDEILSYANQHEIDLIVIGTHGYSGFSHLLLGSVAEKLVRTSKCPVLSVHPTGHQFVSDDVPPG